MSTSVYDSRVLEIDFFASSPTVATYLGQKSIPFEPAQFHENYYTAIVIQGVNSIKSDMTELFEAIAAALHRNGGLVVQGTPGQFSADAISPLLNKAGFKEIIFDSSSDSISLTALKVRDIHAHDLPITEAQFSAHIGSFKKRRLPLLPISFIITIHNEEKNLPTLLSFLGSISNATGADREFIFVLNNCTDNSRGIIEKYLLGSSLKASLAEEAVPGIVPAFKTGIAKRTLFGFVGRFDADVILDPHTLDLMYIHLATNESLKVTYAEPKALDSKSAFNQPWYEPEVVSKRLYYTGKTSLYRENPFEDPFIGKRPDHIITDDVLTSFYFEYTFGLDSISRTPHALVYEKVAGTEADLVSQLSRITSEITRIFDYYPQFRILGNITDQKIFPSDYKTLIDRALKKVEYTDDWIRLESTK